MKTSAIGLESLPAIIRGRRWTVILVALTAIAAALVVSLAAAPKYTATTTLLIDYQEPVPAQLGEGLAPSLQPSYMSTQLGIIASRHVAERVVTMLGLDQRDQWRQAYAETGAEGGEGLNAFIAGALLGSLVVVPGENTRLVNVSFTAGDPNAAAELANAFAAAYREANLEMGTEPARREAEQYQKSLQNLREKVAEAQQHLAAYQRSTGVVASDGRLDVETERLKELVTQRILAEADAHAAEGRLRRVQDLRARKESLATLPEVLQSEVIRDLKADLARRESEFGEVKALLGANHPRYRRAAAEVQAVRAKIAAEADVIAANVEGEVEEARARVMAFSDAEAAQRARLLALGEGSDQMPALVRELESAQANYQQGLARYNQFIMQSGVSQGNVSLLNPALVPTRPSSPILERNLALAVVLGFLLGIGLALLRELMDRRLRTEDEVLEATDTVLLGRLPGAKG